MPDKPNRYTQIIEDIFFQHYQEGDTVVAFKRSEIIEAANRLNIELPKNLGDITYSFRYRVSLPDGIRAKAPADQEWVIRSAGSGRYRFELSAQTDIAPSSLLVETKILDSTPGVIGKYALNDEQALLARLRYNRLVDVFIGLTCYSLQNHLRTTVSGIGQVETDEIYIGLDRRGAHFVLPVQAKGKGEKLGIIQIEQDLAMCAAKFPDLICRPVAAQFLKNGAIALFELEPTDRGIAVSAEKHYRLVVADELSPEELQAYRLRPL